MESNYNSIGPFYDFGSSMASAAASVIPEVFMKAIVNGDYSWRRDLHRLLAWGEYPEELEFPVVFHHSESRDWRDLVHMHYHKEVFLISERVEKILIDNSITGWESYPIIIFDKKGKEIKGYTGFSVTGRGGYFYGAFTPKWEIMCDHHLRKRWDVSQWDGSDLFRIHPNYMITTAKVRDLFIANRIRGAKFTPFSEFVDFI